MSLELKLPRLVRTEKSSLFRGSGSAAEAEHCIPASGQCGEI